MKSLSQIVRILSSAGLAEVLIILSKTYHSSVPIPSDSHIECLYGNPLRVLRELLIVSEKISTENSELFTVKTEIDFSELIVHFDKKYNFKIDKTDDTLTLTLIDNSTPISKAYSIIKILDLI